MHSLRELSYLGFMHSPLMFRLRAQRILSELCAFIAPLRLNYLPANHHPFHKYFIRFLEFQEIKTRPECIQINRLILR